MRPVKIIVEKHEDGYVAYPLGVKGIIVGEGDTYEETIARRREGIDKISHRILWLRHF